jgi:hypothetical protein
MVRQGFDVALTRNGDAGWRALFYLSRLAHSAVSAIGWATTPWRGAIQQIAWKAIGLLTPKPGSGRDSRVNRPT